MAIAEIDAATGNEIILIVRRGRRFLVLRDADTKRFIRFLKRINISVTKAINYRSPRGKGYNLYLDVKATTDIEPNDFERRRDIAADLNELIAAIVTEMFNASIGEIFTHIIAGVEYSSQLEDILYPRVRLYLAWGRNYAEKFATKEDML